MNIPLLEMRCPCSATQQARLRELDQPFATQCHKCKAYLFVIPKIQYKPNKTLITLEVTKVPVPVFKAAADNMAAKILSEVA